MVTERTRYKGFLTTELIVGAVLLGVAIAGLGVSIQGTAAFNRYQWTRQRCTAAAAAQMDSLTTTGRLIDETEMERLWSDVDVVVERMPGATPWDGLERVRVTATASARPREVTITLVRYLAPAVSRVTDAGSGGQS